jgi:hypothetical protein
LLIQGAVFLLAKIGSKAETKKEKESKVGAGKR